MSDQSKASLEPYKGVRDFYPAEQFVQKYILESMARACELFGFEEYNASLLEPAELYRSKTSDEIVNEQTYTFTDRGDREVTLRPEMTPTVARMVAAKKRELPLPIRWYSIPNCFRYERPQRGRLREFWQLNADIFGDPTMEAEVEIISLAHKVMTELGAKSDDFEIRLSDRRYLTDLYTNHAIEPGQQAALTRLLDRREKVENFLVELTNLIGPVADAFLKDLDAKRMTAHLTSLVSRLRDLGIDNITVDTSIVRGFDYYTGMVFEVFDTDPENRRSLFGGGRYDNLLSIFGEEPVPAVGFGMGDVTAQNFLESHGLTPEYLPSCELEIIVAEESAMEHAQKLANQLRKDDVACVVNPTLKRIGDQIRHADRLKIPNIMVVGMKEIANDLYTIKNLATGNERTVKSAFIAEELFSSLG